MMNDVYIFILSLKYFVASKVVASKVVAGKVVASKVVAARL
jgi:hypothetical protein